MTYPKLLFREIGKYLLGRNGRGGIRTHGTISGTLVFKTSPFNRSGTLPCFKGNYSAQQTRPFNRLCCVPYKRSLYSGAPFLSCFFGEMSSKVSRIHFHRRIISNYLLNIRIYPVKVVFCIEPLLCYFYYFII